jgi:hypothetical protein
MAGACAGAVAVDCCGGRAVVVDGFRVRFEAGEALRFMLSAFKSLNNWNLKYIDRCPSQSTQLKD